MTKTEKVAQLRERAAKMRDAARVPTAGGRGEDLVLILIADRLDYDADEIERTLASPQGRAC